MTNTTKYAATLRRLSYNGWIDATADHPALILIQQAYFDFLCNSSAFGDCVAWYAADAIAPDEIRRDGTAPVWRVEWPITNPNAENEEDACDWSTPRTVERTIGEYSLTSCRRY